MADRRGGCDAVLPSELFPPGTMAVPGDTACHEAAPWCGIPALATTQYVDASYPGSDGDGSNRKQRYRLEFA